MVKKEILINRIKGLIKNNPEGFTANKKGILLNLNKGYSVSITNNFNSDIDILINNLFKLIKNHKVKFYNIGGWFSQKENLYYLDISFYNNKLSRSLNIGLKNNQLSIFSFKEFNCININRENKNFQEDLSLLFKFIGV